MEDSHGVDVPVEVFRDVLPAVRDLTELKLVLLVAYLAQGRGTVGVPLEELEAPDIMRILVDRGSPLPARERLKRAVDRAVANGSLLRVTVRRAGGPLTYLLNDTASNRDLIDRLTWAEPEAARLLQIQPDDMAIIYRPNIFAFYERHIGPLTSLVAEQLRDAERSYPRAWIEEAILKAVQYNGRNWRYVEAILTRWEQTGGPDGTARRHPQARPDGA